MIEHGKTIFADTTGEHPRGGKYCGYMSNEYSDKSIDQTGFDWWCRYWNRGFDDEADPLVNYDIAKFGSRDVIDIPSTVNGALFTDLFERSTSLKGRIKQCLHPLIIRKRLKKIKFLLKHQLVISIQEHIAPSRNDGRRQAPNIFDDQHSLLVLFNYLQNRHVWYCTGSELAQYVRLRDAVKLQMIDRHRFSLIDHTEVNLFEDNHEQKITLKVSIAQQYSIKIPDGRIIKAGGNVINVPVLRGQYEIII